MSARVAGFPHWLRDIDATLPATSQYVIHGNIRDRHLVPAGEAVRVLGTVDALWAALAPSGFELLLYCSTVHGLQVWPREDEAAAERARATAAALLDGSGVRPGQEVGHEALAEVLRRVAGQVPGHEQLRVGLVVDYVSQEQPVGQPVPDGLHQVMLRALAQVNAGQRFRLNQVRPSFLYNPLFWLVDKPSDLPTWMVSGSDGIRQVPIPLPDLDLRTAMAERLVPSLPAAAESEGRSDQERAGQSARVARRFAESTEGMTLRGMTEVVQLAVDGEVPRDRVEDAVRGYRLGLLDDPWRRPVLRRRIVDAEATLSVDVKGQPRAVRHAADILVRTTMGLGAAHQRRPSGGPRGVMFFAGPTGVGKTELAKAITRLVFGDERAYIRFDMSEFATEGTEARLLGSPPGYIGHGSGGELTNQVRQRPFSLLLFDEIEKAHPRILDKFLQILSDGRLTDGSGATVHFSETLVVFTSNLGVRGVRPEGDTDKERSASYERQVRESVESAFRDEINRPELLGRIGDNIVVFDPLSEQVAVELAEGFLANVVRTVLAQHRVRVEIPDDVRADLVRECTQDLSLGGRGVGLALESCFVNPLARALVGRVGDPDDPDHEGGTVVVGSVDEVDGTHVVTLR